MICLSDMRSKVYVHFSLAVAFLVLISFSKKSISVVKIDNSLSISGMVCVEKVFVIKGPICLFSKNGDISSVTYSLKFRSLTDWKLSVSSSIFEPFLTERCVSDVYFVCFVRFEVWTSSIKLENRSWTAYIMSPCIKLYCMVFING